MSSRRKSSSPSSLNSRSAGKKLPRGTPPARSPRRRSTDDEFEVSSEDRANDNAIDEHAHDHASLSPLKIGTPKRASEKSRGSGAAHSTTGRQQAKRQLFRSEPAKAHRTNESESGATSRKRVRPVTPVVDQDSAMRPATKKATGKQRKVPEAAPEQVESPEDQMQVDEAGSGSESEDGGRSESAAGQDSAGPDEAGSGEGSSSSESDDEESAASSTEAALLEGKPDLEPGLGAESGPENNDDSDSDDPDAAPTPPSTQPRQNPVVAPKPVAKSSPIKVWRAPVGAAGSVSFASNDGSGNVSMSAALVHIRVLVVGDIGYSVARASRVARKYVIAVNMSNHDVMVIVAYADDATKYMANFKLHEAYSVRLEAKPAQADKPLCIEGHSHFYRTVTNSPILPYAGEKGEEDLAQEFSLIEAQTLLCKPISEIKHAAEGRLVNFTGVVMDVEKTTLRNSVGVKAIVADEKSCVKVMFFEGKSLQRGDSIMIIGGKVWLSPKTKAKEISIWNTAVVSTNKFTVGKKLLDICQRQDRTRLVDVSAVPCFEIRPIEDVKQEALGVEEGHLVHATVMLYLDPYKPANGGHITYNGCHDCMKAVVRTGQDADGNSTYAHSVDGNHKSNTYTSHYYFDGRFKEDIHSEAHYVAKVDDALGLVIFGVTAEELSAMEPEAQTAAIQAGTANPFKFNVSFIKTGEIAQIVVV